MISFKYFVTKFGKFSAMFLEQKHAQFIELYRVYKSLFYIMIVDTSWIKILYGQFYMAYDILYIACNT